MRFGRVAAGFLLLAACQTPEGGDTYEAWFRPLSGFCPRYVVGEDYAWIRGKVAPGYERSGIRQQVFTFRGEFLKDSDGGLKTSNKCLGRPYPIFQLHQVLGFRALADGEKPPGAADAAARSGQLVSSKEKERAAAKAEAEKLKARDFALPSAPAPLGLGPGVAPVDPPSPAKSAVPATAPRVAPGARPAQTKPLRRQRRRRGLPSRLKSRNRRSR